MLTLRRNLATAASSASSRAIFAGLILSRTPIVTPELTKLESQYYEYQSALRERLMWTFPHYFYFKRGTLAERRFLLAQKGPISKQPGVWFPHGVPDIKHNRERSKKQEVNLPKQDREEAGGSQSGSDISRPIVPNSRVTHADQSNDLSSLERRLSRTLYLLVKNKEGTWTFPSFPVEGKPLHTSAEDGLRELGGVDINTWTVSNTPAAALETSEGSHEFLIKSHIIAGKFDLQNKKELTDFAWLTKEEVQERVEARYFDNVGFLLADN